MKMFPLVFYQYCKLIDRIKVVRNLTFIILVLSLLASGLFLYKTNRPSQITPAITPVPAPTPTREKVVDIKASFTIITNGITRSFTNPKYHNQSQDVHISADNPTIVNVKKMGITWQDFFDTLPMKLTKECLTTGDGETYCNKDGSLKFFINDLEGKDLLDRQIKEGDNVLIRFTR